MWRPAFAGAVKYLAFRIAFHEIELPGTCKWVEDKLLESHYVRILGRGIEGLQDYPRHLGGSRGARGLESDSEVAAKTETKFSQRRHTFLTRRTSNLYAYWIEDERVLRSVEVAEEKYFLFGRAIRGPGMS